MAASFASRSAGNGSFNPAKIPGTFFDVLVEVTSGTADYAAGGYAFGLAQLQTCTGCAGASVIESVEVVNHWMASGGATTTNLFIAVWDKVNSKVQAFGMAAAAGVSTGLTEVGNATANLNGRTCTLRVRFQ